MKKIFYLLLILMVNAQWSMLNAQSVTVYEKDTPVGFNVSDIDSIIFAPDKANNPKYQTLDGRRIVDAHWCSLGTSITWYNDNVSSAFTKGYQTRVREVLPFKRFTNKGVNGGVLESAIGQVAHADYYTIEHGINDWGHSTPVGTIDDYKNNTQNGTFAANYRLLIDAIYKANPKAMIVLCTPRKGYGFGTYLPAKCDDPLNGIYLKDYAKLIRQIAAYESLPVADFFALCGNQKNLAKLSIDTALHPNDNGYQLMADVLVQAMRKVLLHPIINPALDDPDEE
ncbi:MAG: SGNH/GDSL hydrolase family protein [Bacteroidaceae bacterium]|nr:SGNH/GDSL hydrolase family protein [Bacteroidaceae bacterium]